jgi:hypothetical protein
MARRVISVGCGTILVALLLAAPVLEAQTVLFNYSFEGASNNATSVATGLTADTLATSGINYLGPASGIAPPDNSTYFGWVRPYSATVGLSTDSASETDWAGALAAGDYFSLGMTVAPGYTVALSSVTVTVGMAGFPNFTVAYGAYSSVTGFSGSPLDSGSVTDATSPTWANLTLGLSGHSALQNLGAGTYELRLYVADNYFTASSAQSEYLDNIQLNGTVSAIPEPSIWAAIAGTAALAVVARRRQLTSKSTSS